MFVFSQFLPSGFSCYCFNIASVMLLKFSPDACFLLIAYRDKAPGQRECDEAIEVLNNCIREVDQASLAAISQQLSPRDDISHEVCNPS